MRRKTPPRYLAQSLIHTDPNYDWLFDANTIILHTLKLLCLFHISIFGISHREPIHKKIVLFCYYTKKIQYAQGH